MELVTSQKPVFDPGTVFPGELRENEGPPANAGSDAGELAYEVGLWLSGLESFLRTSDHSFAENNRINDSARDWSREFRLSHSVLLRCAKLNFEFRKALAASGTGPDKISAEDSDELLQVLRDAIALNGGLARAHPLRFEEWKAWKLLLHKQIGSSPVVEKFIANAEKSAEDYLPENLVKLLQSKPIPFADQADLLLILPRFAKILKSLSVIGRMLRDDEPLKSALLIFSRILEQTQELITYINNRLSRFPDEGAELFSSLDGASYTASLELKKVYQQELAGIAEILPSPSVYLRVETAHALLNDSLQQILAGFAQLIEPGSALSDFFPNFRIKLEESQALRQRLWEILQAVRAAERDTVPPLLDNVNTRLTAFLKETIQFLFFKDRETIERFTEEIIAAGGRKDLVPILHRFGAYLETLFNQVKMRHVLANYPFDEK